MELHNQSYSNTFNSPTLSYRSDLRQVDVVGLDVTTKLVDSFSLPCPMIEISCESFNSCQRIYCCRTCSLNYLRKTRCPFSILRSSCFWKHKRCPFFQEEFPLHDHHRLCLVLDSLHYRLCLLFVPLRLPSLRDLWQGFLISSGPYWQTFCGV